VFINGQRVGETPLAGYPVSSGTIRVVLHNPDTGKRLTRSLQVAPGARASIKEDLR
jgi:hypothetical protein